MKQIPEFKNLHIKRLEDLGDEIEFEREEEEISPEDGLYTDEQANYVREQYNNGNEYAWFSAKVTVKYKGFEATDYLGCCSYKSEKDFKQNSGYYKDMVMTCISEINKD